MREKIEKVEKNKPGSTISTPLHVFFLLGHLGN
jgi:hypothetical protein